MSHCRCCIRLRLIVMRLLRRMTHIIMAWLLIRILLLSRSMDQRLSSMPCLLWPRMKSLQDSRTSPTTSMETTPSPTSTSPDSPSNYGGRWMEMHHWIMFRSLSWHYRAMRSMPRQKASAINGPCRMMVESLPQSHKTYPISMWPCKTKESGCSRSRMFLFLKVRANR